MTAALVDVVAAKTGYPAEMLSLEMELESDLGIDSIKRVQILSAMQDRMPELPVVDAGAMARLLTLRQIVDHLAAHLAAHRGPDLDAHLAEQSAGSPSAPAAVNGSAPAVTAPTVAPVAIPAAGPSLAEMTAALVDVVAAKTGYPAEMLSLEMELESDLGVDSIKRVQILSAMQDRMPELPVVDAGAMARLLTLRQIVDHWLPTLMPDCAEQLGATADPGQSRPVGEGSLTGIGDGIDTAPTWAVWSPPRSNPRAGDADHRRGRRPRRGDRRRRRGRRRAGGHAAPNRLDAELVGECPATDTPVWCSSVGCATGRTSTMPSP